MFENFYGILKRLDYVEKVINEYAPESVLDVGCGTGELLTKPLAESFPDRVFVGVDDDNSSIEFARGGSSFENLTFLYPGELETSARFDLIIASEVIEHVERPEHLLLEAARRLKPSGKMIITLPNGYGPFEATSFFDTTWNSSLAERLPPQLISDWMFLIDAVDGESDCSGGVRHNRNRYERFRRAMNRRRWGLLD